MTALPGPPLTPNRMQQNMAATLSEVFAARPYPLDEATWTRALFSGVLNPLIGLVGLTLPPPGAMFSQNDSVLEQFNPDMRPRPGLATLIAPIRLIALALRNDPAHADQPTQARLRCSALESLDFKQLAWADLLAAIDETLGLAYPLAGQLRVRYLPRPMLAAGMLALLMRATKPRQSMNTLLSGVASHTVRANHSLETLAEQVRGDAALLALFRAHEPANLHAALIACQAAGAFMRSFNDFLDQFGHRDTSISTAFAATWKDAPAQPLAIIKGLAQSEPRHDVAPAAWEVARDAVLAALRSTPLRGLFLRLLRSARYLWLVRENTHFELTRMLPPLRRGLLECGRRLVAAGVIETPESIFHLRYDEVARADPAQLAAATRAELRTAATRRAARRAALADKPLVDPRLYRQSGPAGGALLRGSPGSAGVATGPVRVIHSNAEFDKLQTGEVLVAAFTNPSWTPLFQRACAVVVDGGGSASHAAIVAREYGIPAVMGVADGTRLLRDGQVVRVDGGRGVVEAA